MARQRREARRARELRAGLEGLEVRALLATIPAAVTSGSLQNLSTMMGNIGGSLNVGTNSTEEVVDPQDPSKIVAVWDVNDTTMAAITLGGEVTAVEAAYTVDGGQTWVALFSEPTNVAGLPSQPSLLNPATSGPTVPYAYQTNPDVGFDNANNFYILTEYSTGAAAGGVASSGALVLQKYSFSGSTPTAVQFTNNEQDPNLYAGGGFGGANQTSTLKVIYQWLASGSEDGIIDPTMTVDDNQATLPPSVSSQVDPNSGNVYVSWTTVDQPTYEDPLGGDFNPYRIMTTVSSDGGNDFSPVTVADVNSDNANDVDGEQGAANGPAGSGSGGIRDFNPAMTVSQGRAPSESGLSGDPGIAGGQVTLTWDDAAGNTLMANTISAGHDSSFGQQEEHFIPVASTDTTDFTIDVNLSNITDLTTLDARVDIIDPNDQYLGLILIAPNGQTFVLQDPGALTGGNEGVVTYTDNNIADYELGTIFDDNATRVIGDLSESAPYIGDYVPDGDARGGFGGGGGTLDSFMKGLGSSVNGTWTLETVDTNTSTSASPGFLLDWSLSFGRGLTADNDVVIPGSNGLVVPISTTGGVPTTVVPASGAPIGPDVSMAVDNTLGAYSPYEGRIYAAFTGYYDVTVAGIQNPSSNTDVFLTYSDDGGRSWSAPEEINQDNAQVDGLSGGEESNPDDLFTGRTQFQATLTIDPATGTLVAAWRDASADPNNTLVATEIATSIDGGASFSQENYANPSLTATDAIDTQTKVLLGPEGDNGTATNAADGTYGFGTSMGLAAYDGQVYPLWTGNLDEVTIVGGVPTLDSLSALFQPMVIAAGPRIVDSTQGPIPYAEAASGNVTFTVTFDRPINPSGIDPSFIPADVEVFYHNTTDGSPSVPVDVTGITPVASSGVGPGGKFGYTEFTVTFDPLKAPGGGSSGISDFTGTYSYLVAPDDGAGDPIEADVSSYVISPVPKPVIGPIASRDVPLQIPISGTGGTGTADDFTTSTLAVAGYTNQVITSITVNLTLTHQDGADLVIRLTAPDGQSALVYRGTVNGPLTLNNAAFVAQGDTGGPVDGTYTLTIDDTQSNNIGTLTGWSVTINSELPTLGLQPGAPDDQNADGTTDENPMTMPDGYTGLTPGDVYAVPTPDLTAPTTFTTAQSILSPPFNTNTLPLIVPGPQIISTQAVGVNASGQQLTSTGTDDLLMDDTTSEYQVTFDRPVQTSSFTGAQVLSITGPTGPITGPQPFASTAVDQSIPAATRSLAGVVTDGTLSSTISVNSNDTLTIADLTVSLSIGATSDAGLSAVLIAPDGTQIPLFADLRGANLTNTVFDDSAESYITQGAAPYTGTFKPGSGSGSATLSSLDTTLADGTWTLQVTNTGIGAAATLDTWALNITPTITVTPVNPVPVTVGGASETVATTFSIGFPQQQLSGTYTIQLAPGIEDQFGNQTDVSQTAGVNVLRGVQQNGPTTTTAYTAADTPKTIPASTQIDTTGAPIPGTNSSTIVVPDSFIISGDKTASGQSVMQVQLNINFADDPDLTATLTHYGPGGAPMGTVTLFSGVGQGQNAANFDNTVFDDNAATPIQEGNAPFFATYDPQESLANVFAPAVGMNVQGTWVLTLSNTSTAAAGSINGWSLTFQKPEPTSGLGVQGEGPTVSFRLQNLSPSDALSSQSWTPVGAASSTDETGEVTAIAVDPSDASGNTVYVGGASGGVWKTTDFLTTSANGPTWIPLTNFGPSAAINISSIAVFPRNGDPNDSIIVVATGNSNSGQEITDAPGVGFLISMDGGATWNVYDSTVNVSGSYTQTTGSGDLLPIDSPLRDRAFVGDTVNQVAVDPQLSPTGQVIIYAALSGPNGGIWRSENTGQTWTQVIAGNATAVVLDQDSGIVLDPVTGTDVQGNLQLVYAGITGTNGDGDGPTSGGGVFMSTNQGQSWALMGGNVGNPLIIDDTNDKNVNPGTPTGPDTAANPNGGEGKIVLAVPAPTGNAEQDAIYDGWLYAAVATPTGGFYGLFETKDFGENWTDVELPSLPPLGGYNEAVPTDSTTGTVDGATVEYPITDDIQGNIDLALTVDPTDPNITYLGGFGGNGYNSDTGLIRVDATKVADAHSLVSTDDQSPGYGLTLQQTGYTTQNFLTSTPVWLAPNANGTFTLDPTPYLNFIRDPDDPFLTDATLYTDNYNSFVNSGLGASWTPFDVPTTSLFNPPGGNNEISGTGYQVLLTEVDPTTGLPRILAGNMDGVYSGLDDDGTFETTVGSSDATPSVNRNGNLQLGQYYYVAAQPSAAAAIKADTLFVAGGQSVGGQNSDPNLLTDGNLTWSAIGDGVTGYTTPASADADGGTYYIASGTAVDQQGDGTVYQFFSPRQGGEYTNFVLVQGVGRTFNLLQASNGLPTPDPQWGLTSYASIVVDPVNGQDLMLSSSTGNIFASTNQGKTWFDVGAPATFGLTATGTDDGETSFALAYGAPDPSAPQGVGNLGNFMYVGTQTGEIYVSQNAGGNWLNISEGLDGSPIQQIITDPSRSSHDAYAVTTTGVFYLPNSILLAQNPTVAADGWVNITGDLKSLSYSVFGTGYTPGAAGNPITYNLANVLNSIAANWNYAIPNNPDDLADGYHPVLYVAADSGVFMSTDQGQTWVLYPSTTYGATVDGGDLPHADITDLSLSQGNISVATGMADLAGPYNPDDPHPAITVTGTAITGSPFVTGLNTTTNLLVGDVVTVTGAPSALPADTTILSIDAADGTMTLSNDVTLPSGTDTASLAFSAAQPADPDLLLAGTYGEGAFAINLAPMLLSGTVAIDGDDTGGTTTGGAPIVTTASPTIDGLSEITGFGDATWVTIVDETPTDPTYGQVIGGFDPATVAYGQAIPITAADATDAFGNFAVPLSTAFSTNGTKTIEVYTTDDAGAQSVPVTLTFDLQATDLSHPNPTAPPATPTLELTPTTPPYSTSGGIPITNNTSPLLDGSAQAGPNGTSITVTENWTESNYSFVGTLTSGSKTITNVNVAGLLVGDTVTDPSAQGYLPAGTTITALNSTADTITLSAAATQSGTALSLAAQDFITFTLPSSDITAAGADEDFSFPFEDFEQGGAPVSGIFDVTVTATYNTFTGITQAASQPSGPSDVVTFQIDDTTPSPASSFRLNPASDTGIVGDDVTSDRTPQFIGVTSPGNTVQIFVSGEGAAQNQTTAIPGFTGNLIANSPTVTNISGTTGLVVGQLVTGTGIPSGTTITGINAAAGTLTLSQSATATATGESLASYDVAADGKPYNFVIQLPYSLTNGETSVYVEVTDLAGNVSVSSNTVGVSIVSEAADYDGTTTSDPALFDRVTSSNEVQWLVQTPSGALGPWFGTSDVPYIPSATLSGVLVNGSSVVTGLSETSSLAVGYLVTGTGIPAGTTIKAISGTTSVTLSGNATTNGTQTLTFLVPATELPANQVVPFDGDFDGDGESDLAYYDLANATWTIFESSNARVNGATTFTLGTPGASLPVVGHFDADGPTEAAVATENAQGQEVMLIASAQSGTRTINFGIPWSSANIPLAGDFDGIGYDEPAVYQASTGNFLVYNPRTQAVETKTIAGLASSPDLASMVPVPGQYDNLTYFQDATNPTLPFSGITEPAVFDTKTGVFTILGPNGVYTVSGFQPGDIPAPADYLGAGSDQVVVYRPGTGQFIEGSASGQTTTLATLGGSGDIPVTSPLPYRLPGSTDIATGTGSTGTGSTGTGSTGTGSTGTGSTGTGSNSGSSTSTSPTPTPTPTPPPVALSSVEMVANKKHKVTEIVVSFSGALNAAEAQDLGEYTLVMAGSRGSFTAKNATKIKLKAVEYDSASNTVVLIPRKAFAVSKKVELKLNTTPPSGVVDSVGRSIVGDATVVLSRQNVSKAITAGSASSVASAVDALLELNALAEVTPAGSGGRKRR